KALPQVAKGLWLNIRILLVSVIGVAFFATLLAAARTLGGPIFFPIRFLAAAYTDIFRGVPFLVVLYLIGFGIPALNPTTRIPVAFL
ncbi:ABC transporter permease subunit, partial [Streptococcus anginosus]|nr:ABC transporter permease subunit [Streptococcus anginosus]